MRQQVAADADPLAGVFILRFFDAVEHEILAFALNVAEGGETHGETAFH